MARGSVTYKSAIIDETNAGDKEIVAAVSNTVLNIHAIYITASAAMSVRMESAAGGTAMTGVMKATTAKDINIGFSNIPWMATASGSSISLELSGTGDIDGVIIYSEVATA